VWSDDSEQQNLLAVKAQIEAVARGDIDALLAHAHADVQLDIFAPPGFDWIRHARGRADVRRAIEQNFGSVEDQQPQINTVMVQADTVVLMGREQGRIKGSNIAYSVEFVEKFQFRGTRLAAVTILVASR
jgi:ketosteroid isomerase-like protein